MAKDQSNPFVADPLSIGSLGRNLEWINPNEVLPPKNKTMIVRNYDGSMELRLGMDGEGRYYLENMHSYALIDIPPVAFSSVNGSVNYSDDRPIPKGYFADIYDE